MDISFTLFSQATLPWSFWDEAFSIIVCLIDRLPTPILNQLSPLEKLFDRKHNYSSPKILWSKYYPFTIPYQPHKLCYRSTSCTFLGYNLSHTGYKCLSQEGHIYISRHVLFNKNSFPLHLYHPIIYLHQQKNVSTPPIKSIIHKIPMNHNEERQHIDTITDNTDHINPIIVYPLEVCTYD